MQDPTAPDGGARKSRLASADRSKELLPWRRAESMTKCSLYWMPATAFPLPQAEKAWLLEFTSMLGARLKKDLEAGPWVYLQYQTAVSLHDEFIRHAQQFLPLMGLGHRPGSDMPDMPSEAEIMAAVEEKRKIDVSKYTSDYAYWFLSKSDLPQRELFQGLGGMTILYRKPDPKAKPPELAIPVRYRDHQLFKTFDVNGLLAGACSMQDEFLKKSKLVFGADMKQNIQTEFLPFILPLLGTANFFQMKEEDLKAAFDLFDVYMHESPGDYGIVLASKEDLDETLIELVAAMRQSAAQAEPGVRR